MEEKITLNSTRQFTWQTSYWNRVLTKIPSRSIKAFLFKRVLISPSCHRLSRTCRFINYNKGDKFQSQATGRHHNTAVYQQFLQIVPAKRQAMAHHLAIQEILQILECYQTSQIPPVATKSDHRIAFFSEFRKVSRSSKTTCQRDKHASNRVIPRNHRRFLKKRKKAKEKIGYKIR